MGKGRCFGPCFGKEERKRKRVVEERALTSTRPWKILTSITYWNPALAAIGSSMLRPALVAMAEPKTRFAGYRAARKPPGI